MSHGPTLGLNEQKTISLNGKIFKIKYSLAGTLFMAGGMTSVCHKKVMFMLLLPRTKVNIGVQVKPYLNW